jgi:hypothetical protein
MPSISGSLRATDASHSFWITLAVVFVEFPARLVLIAAAFFRLADYRVGITKRFRPRF